MPQIELLNTSGKSTKKINLNSRIFGSKIRPQLMSQAVRIYLSNQRQSPASTKSRGEVKVSKRKIWRQKGTGRARHGSRNAPIFVGGAVAHGPRGNQNYQKKLPQKMKQLSLFSALTTHYQQKSLKIITGFNKLQPKTKIVNLSLEKIIPQDQKFGLVISSDQTNLQKAVKNISRITLLKPLTLNTYEALNCQALVFTQKAVKDLQKHYA